MNKVAVYVLCLVYSTAGLAQAVTETPGTFVAPGVTKTPVNLNGGTILAPGVPPPAPVPQSTINQGANTGQQSQNNGSGANNAAGAALIAAGTPLLAQPPTMPIGMMLIAMGILALMQGGADSGAADQSGNTAANSAINPTGVTTGPDGKPTPPTPASDSGALSAFSTTAGKQAVASIQAAGGDLTPAGLTLPDGTTVPLSSLSSASAMNAAGLPGNQAMAAMEAALKKAGLLDNSGHATSMAMNEGGGGGSVPNQFGANAATFKMPKFNNPFDLSAADRARMVAGKTVSMGGDPIGVKMDNIFTMIHRAYDRKQAANDFISNSAGIGSDVSPGLLLRAPASVMRKKK